MPGFWSSRLPSRSLPPHHLRRHPKDAWSPGLLLLQ
nr:MAG TPA: hypothetical protein [Caudoviricetes sp.]